jgi:hypothetical protein
VPGRVVRGCQGAGCVPGRVPGGRGARAGARAGCQGGCQGEQSVGARARGAARAGARAAGCQGGCQGERSMWLQLWAYLVILTGCPLPYPHTMSPGALMFPPCSPSIPTVRQGGGRACIGTAIALNGAGEPMGFWQVSSTSLYDLRVPLRTMSQRSWALGEVRIRAYRMGVPARSVLL